MCKDTVVEKLVVEVIHMYKLFELVVVGMGMGMVEAVMVEVGMVVVEMVVVVMEAVVVLLCGLKVALLLEVVEICRCKEPLEMVLVIS